MAQGLGEHPLLLGRVDDAPALPQGGKPFVVELVLSRPSGDLREQAFQGLMLLEAVADDRARLPRAELDHGGIEELLLDLRVDLELFLEGAEDLALLFRGRAEVLSDEPTEHLVRASEDFSRLHRN